MALFGNMTGTETDAVQLLEEDHNKVKDLFERFKDAKDRRSKQQIVKEALEALTVHAAIEEEIFYPAVRDAHEDQEEADAILDAALQEHHVAKILISELKEMSPSDEFFDAKFRVLSESVKHHIDEEESEIFSKVSEDGTNWEELATRMKARKGQLLGRSSPRGRSSAVGRDGGARGRATKATGARTRNPAKLRRGSGSKAAARRK